MTNTHGVAVDVNRTVTTLDGMKIPPGRIFVRWIGDRNPNTGNRVCKVAIDNGTGIRTTFPTTFVWDKDIDIQNW